jgi:hypothetical protein
VEAVILENDGTLTVAWEGEGAWQKQSRGRYCSQRHAR